MFADVNFCFLAVIDNCDGVDGVHQRGTPAAWRERERHTERERDRQSVSQGASVVARSLDGRSHRENFRFATLVLRRRRRDC